MSEKAIDSSAEDVPVLSRVDNLEAWLDSRKLGVGAPVETRFISGGAQNEIFEITRGDLHAVLRRPPATAPADRDTGIMREWRIINALNGSDVPHTEAIAACDDTSVLGRPFYLMGFVDGWSPMDSIGTWPEPFNTDPQMRTTLAYELVRDAAEMSKFDWRGAGLEGLGRPDGFHERQVQRWTSFFERIKTRELPGYDEVTAWLTEHKPLDYIPGLMHGDYQFANVMFSHGGPAQMAAIIDWEMGTIGDPKLDLGWILQSWPDDNGSGGTYEYVDMSGMPGRREITEYYAQVSGRQVDDVDYYYVLAQWKPAIVLEQGYQRAGDNPMLQAFGPVILESMRAAAEYATQSDYQG